MQSAAAQTGAADEPPGFVTGLSCLALPAVARFTLLRVLVLLSFARDAGLCFGFAVVIGISLSCAATIAATTEAPPRL